MSAVVAGSYHCLAVAKTEPTSSGGAPTSHGQLGVPYDFTAAASNQLVYFPMRVDELSGRGFVDGDGGEAHTVMLSSAGKAYAFGRSAYGRLGLAAASTRRTANRTPPSGTSRACPRRVVAVVAGSSNSGAVTESGEAYAWGYGDLYQLGRGKTTRATRSRRKKSRRRKKWRGSESPRCPSGTARRPGRRGRRGGSPRREASARVDRRSHRATYRRVPSKGISYEKMMRRDATRRRLSSRGPPRAIHPPGR